MSWQIQHGSPIPDGVSETDEDLSEARPSTDPSLAGGDSDLAIGAVCDRTGLSARTVRYYEELGLLPGVRRHTGGRRVYGSDELERLRFIQRLKTLGLTLQEIKQLNALYALAGSTTDMLLRLDDLLDSHLTGLDHRIAELTHLRDEMSSYRQHVASRIEADGETNGEMSKQPSAPSKSGAAAADPSVAQADIASRRPE